MACSNCNCVTQIPFTTTCPNGCIRVTTAGVVCSNGSNGSLIGGAAGCGCGCGCCCHCAQVESSQGCCSQSNSNTGCCGCNNAANCGCNTCNTCHTCGCSR